MDPLDRPELLTPREAANVLGVGVSWLGYLAREGRIVGLLTPGGHRRYTWQEVERVRDEPAPERLSDEARQLIADVVRLYEQGWAIRRVAAEFGFSYGKTRRLLIRHTTLRARAGEQRA